ncbi:hypothetical protein M438DRAFT_338353 [Aureobasidium pullulans EXF-150]|uniref:Uncharacterized protein n=1 Tax=Aureobasidium pullulans EXF-150 TaxID=1043002 RepID=A0A074Y243_AURPU|nr:uncharacterized protein M438DRAFT_338353 [Aureobasidium pullulans EXF-150]KEQ80966.1 hypothetical protein M438DRAFT_338353 [Aureobasidium pullulans EXF-150]
MSPCWNGLLAGYTSQAPSPSFIQLPSPFRTIESDSILRLTATAVPPKMAGRRRVSPAEDSDYTTIPTDLIWQTSGKAQESDSELVQIFRFLDLPSEVRNLSYGKLFTNPGHKLESGRRYLPTRSSKKPTKGWKPTERWYRAEAALPRIGEMDEKAGVLVHMNLIRTCA